MVKPVTIYLGGGINEDAYCKIWREGIVDRLEDLNHVHVIDPTKGEDDTWKRWGHTHMAKWVSQYDLLYAITRADIVVANFCLPNHPHIGTLTEWGYAIGTDKLLVAITLPADEPETLDEYFKQQKNTQKFSGHPFITEHAAVIFDGPDYLECAEFLHAQLKGGN